MSTYSLWTGFEEEEGLVQPFLAGFEVRHYDCVSPIDRRPYGAKPISCYSNRGASW